MIDLSKTIEPKSDQLNADSLIGGPMTITITKLTADPATPEQPIAVHFDGDGGKPYKPCKSMRRVMVNAWGDDGSKYAGRSMTLYRDAKVAFGGMAVGGIRISHLSHIEHDVTMALTSTRAKRVPYTVKRLEQVVKAPDLAERYASCQTAEHFAELEQERKDTWSQLSSEQKQKLKAASDAAKSFTTRG